MLRKLCKGIDELEQLKSVSAQQVMSVLNGCILYCQYRAVMRHPTPTEETGKILEAAKKKLAFHFYDEDGGDRSLKIALALFASSLQDAEAWAGAIPLSLSDPNDNSSNLVRLGGEDKKREKKQSARVSGSLAAPHSALFSASSSASSSSSSAASSTSKGKDDGKAKKPKDTCVLS